MVTVSLVIDEFSLSTGAIIPAKNASGYRIHMAGVIQNPPLTQEQLIAKLQVQYGIEPRRGMMSRIENKDRYITNLELIAISKVLKVSIHWLLGEGSDDTILQEKR